jgi:diacylglycerol kinase (ATP)
MEEILKKHTISFKNAFAGLRWAVSTQPNFRIHLVLSLVAVLLGVYFSITVTEWAVIVFTILLGLTAELINTAIESMTDLITKEWREEAKIAKDVSAGMMLTVAIGAVVIAIIIFGQYI